MMDKAQLLSRIHRGAVRIQKGPLLVLYGSDAVGYGETVLIRQGTDERRGSVLETGRDRIVIQVFEGTHGLAADELEVVFGGEPLKLGVGPELLGRVLGGMGQPLDGGPPILPKLRLDAEGAPLNPVARDCPADFVQTGFSVIDGLNTLVRGQKLPIFTGAGLPANRLAAEIAVRARVREEEPFAVVLTALGITHREAVFFRASLEAAGAAERVLFILNLADDPAMERIMAARSAVTAAEYLAYEKGMHVLVILTDMTNYCEALRELSAAREELPGRRGYPSYLYTDLARIYERAGRIRGREGSVTQLVILTMPDDDITHPIPDLTGYITEGQIVLSRELHRRGIYPPVDVLPSLSRLMRLGIGEGKTRADHRPLAGRLYAAYAKGRDVRRLESIVGREALSETDLAYLGFAEAFERRFIHQGDRARTLEETLDLGWELLLELPDEELRHLPPEELEKRRRA